MSCEQRVDETADRRAAAAGSLPSAIHPSSFQPTGYGIIGTYFENFMRKFLRSRSEFISRSGSENHVISCNHLCPDRIGDCLNEVLLLQHLCSNSRSYSTSSSHYLSCICKFRWNQQRKLENADPICASLFALPNMKISSLHRKAVSIFKWHFLTNKTTLGIAGSRFVI